MKLYRLMISAMCSLQYFIARSQAVKPSSSVSKDYVFEIAETVDFTEIAGDLVIPDHRCYMHQALSLFAP